MGKKEIYILGVGRNTEVYIDLVEACGYIPAGLYHYNDNRTGESIHGVKILDSNENLFTTNNLDGKYFAISVGDNKIRNDLANKLRTLGAIVPTLIHPSAVVSKYAKTEDSVIIHANAVVQAGALIEMDTVVSYNASVSHTSKIGKACYIAFGACIGAYVAIKNFVLIGQSASIVSGKVNYIGSNAIVGAGSVVIKNVEAETIVAGNPAKVLKSLLHE
jgi:sugar O-acyltransferase (sialic acid O-acetyltransferase NeuD family)